MVNGCEFVYIVKSFKNSEISSPYIGDDAQPCIIMHGRALDAYLISYNPLDNPIRSMDKVNSG